MQVLSGKRLTLLVAGRSGNTNRRCRAVHAAHPVNAADTSQEPAYPYNSGDDRNQKATLEHIFQPGAIDTAASAPSTSGSISAPWSVGWQMNERNMVWNNDLKLRLIKNVTCRDLGISEQELEQRLQTLGNLLPGLWSYLPQPPPKLVVALVANTDQIAGKLVTLKSIFPQADLTAMVTKRISLLLEDDMEDIAAAAQRLKELLPDIKVDLFAEAFPTVLDIKDFEMALEDAARIMPNVDVPKMLRSNPEMILSLQKGKNLIVYDQIENPWS